MSKYEKITDEQNHAAQVLFLQQRKVAEASQKPELSLEEINEEIRAAREELRKKKAKI